MTRTINPRTKRVTYVDRHGKMKVVPTPQRTVRYLFFERDPLLDDVVSLMRNSKMTYKALAAASGVSKTTLHNWDRGHVHWPQIITVANVLAALGKRIGIADDTSNITPILPKRK